MMVMVIYFIRWKFITIIMNICLFSEDIEPVNEEDDQLGPTGVLNYF